MYPILFQHGRLTLFTYGLLLAAGFLAALWLVGREARRRGLDPRQLQDLGVLVIVGAIVGSRLLYVLLEWEHFLRHPLEILALWKGGLVFYGGFGGAVLAALWYVRRKRLPLWTTADVVAPAVALGQTFGRLGCFFAGCCYGAPCALPWAVTFTDPRGLAPLGVALHPTQLYSTGANFAIFAVLYWVARPRQRFEGQLLGLYLVLEPTARFLVELVRGDPRGTLGPLSTSQALGILLFSVGLWVLARGRRASP
ncbi:MAG: prolipoprotein diacylglyceryl transferase [Deferrisomatales bacterium]|nr:prolipoprotein diacylglyceryl transferase [Deferrisomatales bacterium]